jgi:hypothetical protein
MHQSTIGGSSETEAKELTVIPICSAALDVVVTTATPVGKQPSAVRNARESKESVLKGIGSTLS